MYRAIILIKIIPFSKYDLSDTVGRQTVHFAQFNIDSYRIGPFAGLQGKTCEHDERSK